MSDDQNALPPGQEKASNAQVHNYLKITKLMPASYLFPFISARWERNENLVRGDFG